jgi:N-methylhydantoinase A/oxoprolinase/acetone carboxylase beta subunit
VLAALGLVVSQRRRDVQRTVLLGGDALTAAAIAATVEELGARARGALGEPAAELRATYELRYRGQAFELPIVAGTNPDPDELRRAFEAEHAERYGYADPEQQLELVTIRVTASGAGADVALAAEPTPEPRRSRREAARFELDVVHGPPLPGTVIDGPAVIELSESTVLVPSGWGAEVDDMGTVRMGRR